MKRYHVTSVLAAPLAAGAYVGTAERPLHFVSER